jgi:hypothetical protein
MIINQKRFSRRNFNLENTLEMKMFINRMRRFPKKLQERKKLFFKRN